MQLHCRGVVAKEVLQQVRLPVPNAVLMAQRYAPLHPAYRIPPALTSSAVIAASARTQVTVFSVPKSDNTSSKQQEAQTSALVRVVALQEGQHGGRVKLAQQPQVQLGVGLLPQQLLVHRGTPPQLARWMGVSPLSDALAVLDQCSSLDDPMRRLRMNNTVSGQQAAEVQLRQQACRPPTVCQPSRSRHNPHGKFVSRYPGTNEHQHLQVFILQLRR